MALTLRGVEVKAYDYARGWVLKWMKWLKLRKFDQGSLGDVRQFVAFMRAEGKKYWQISHAV